MSHIEDLFELDLPEATALVCDQIMHDVADGLNRIMPLVVDGDLMAVSRYLACVEKAALVLTALPERNPGHLPPSSVVYSMICQDTVGLRWLAPTLDGPGVIMVLVDRLRWFAGGVPQVCGLVSRDVDVHSFRRLEKAVAEATQQREQASPLRRAMDILDLNSSDVARLMGVKRQAVDKWLLTGPPPLRTTKIATLATLAEVLRHRLREGFPAAVVRRPADAYGGRSMLDVIADDEHEWLLNSVRDSFDFHQVA